MNFAIFLKTLFFTERVWATASRITVSNIKMSVCKNQCIINGMMWNSFEGNAGICQLSGNLRIC